VREIICLGFGMKTKESALIMPSNTGDVVLGVCRIGPKYYRTISFCFMAKSPSWYHLYWTDSLTNEISAGNIHRTNLFFLLWCIYISEIMSHFGLQMDSDFQNAIYKNVARSERSVNVRVSSQQLSTVRADIVVKVQWHLFFWGGG